MIYLAKYLAAGENVEKGMESATKDILKEVKEFIKFFDGNKLGEVIINILFAILIYFVGRKIVKINICKDFSQELITSCLSLSLPPSLSHIYILLSGFPFAI